MEKDRGSGRTTRLVDYYIQKLFHNPNIFIEPQDHFEHLIAHKELIKRISQRLVNEHPRVKFEVNKNIEIKIIK